MTIKKDWCMDPIHIWRELGGAPPTLFAKKSCCLRAYRWNAQNYVMQELCGLFSLLLNCIYSHQKNAHPEGIWPLKIVIRLAYHAVKLPERESSALSLNWRTVRQNNNKTCIVTHHPQERKISSFAGAHAQRNGELFLLISTPLRSSVAVEAYVEIFPKKWRRKAALFWRNVLP